MRNWIVTKFSGLFHGKKHGFTLAEVLIALAIVGIIAGITIPALVNNYNNKAFKSMYKKERLSLISALDIYMTDSGKTSLKATPITTSDGVSNFLKDYMRTSTCPGGKTGSCFADAYKNSDGNTADSGISALSSCVLSKDGAGICMGPLNFVKDSAGNVTEDKGLIVVDANGAAGPNILGLDLKKSCYNSSGKVLSGEACGHDNDEIADVVTKANIEIDTSACDGANVDVTAGNDVKLNNLRYISMDVPDDMVFDRWDSSGCSASGSAKDGKVTGVTQSCRVTAVCHWKDHTITANNNGACHVSASPTTLHYGETSTVTSSNTDSANYEQNGFNTDCSLSGNTITMQHKDCSITPNCKKIPKATITFDSSTCDGNTKTVSGRTDESFSISAPSVTPDASKTVTSDWTGNCQKSGDEYTFASGGNSCTMTKTCGASKFNVTVESSTCTLNTTNLTGISYNGSAGPATASPETGGTFDGWTAGSGCQVSSPSNQSTNVTYVTSNCVITAKCSAPSKITLTVESPTCSNPTGSGSYVVNTSHAIGVTVPEDYKFAGWTADNGCNVNPSNQSSSTATVGSQSCKAIATCTEDKHPIGITQGAGTCGEGAVSLTLSKTTDLKK
ncbi:MAG: type II secretion system GspH family protein, partial [Clostridiaceae bacterium]|nr:type II secretion system GspH family protein [Clostridiaceae bacterium]